MLARFDVEVEVVMEVEVRGEGLIIKNVRIFRLKMWCI